MTLEPGIKLNLVPTVSVGIHIWTLQRPVTQERHKLYFPRKAWKQGDFNSLVSFLKTQLFYRKLVYTRNLYCELKQQSAHH